jgi:hypothetical protein
MSEYQYYEFLAIDRPLTAEETEALRALSTRANITPVSLTNEYNWGDFKGDSGKLMQRYFDAHVYVANWMTAIFMVRLPIDTLSKETAKAMEVAYMLDFKTTQTHWIITWSLEESENYDRFGMEDGRGWMARLAPLRDELLRGDIRSLYIGWLAAVTGEMMDDHDMEPLSVNGLGNLTPSQNALAEFLEVDPDLLAGAGIDSSAAQVEEISQKEMDEWIEGLPKGEVKAVMKQLLEGKGQQAERTLKHSFMAWWRGLQSDKAEAPRRTVGELRRNAEKVEKIHLEQRKRDRIQRKSQRQKEREAYLKTLSKNFPKMWKLVQQTVKRGSGLAYDEACRSIVDISEAYTLLGNHRRFRQELKKFMANHMRRKALIQRLAKVGIWEGK